MILLSVNQPGVPAGCYHFSLPEQPPAGLFLLLKSEKTGPLEKVDCEFCQNYSKVNKEIAQKPCNVNKEFVKKHCKVNCVMFCEL